MNGVNKGEVLGGFMAGYEAAVERIEPGWVEVHGIYKAQGLRSVRSACRFFETVPSQMRFTLYHLSSAEARLFTNLLFDAGVLDAAQLELLCSSFANLRSERSGRYRALYDREKDTPYVYFGSPDYSGRIADAKKEECLFALYCKLHEYWHLVLHILSGRTKGPAEGGSVVSAAAIVAGEAFAMKGPMILSHLLYRKTGESVYLALGMTYYPAEEHSDKTIQTLWSDSGLTDLQKLLSCGSSPYLAYTQDIYGVEAIDAGYYAQACFFDRLLECRGYDLGALLCDLLEFSEETDVSYSDCVPASSLEELEGIISGMGCAAEIERKMMKLMATCSDGEEELREIAAQALAKYASGSQ